MSLVVPAARSRTKTLLPLKGNPLTGCVPPGGGVGSTGLLVRSVALLVKASSLPSGLKTGSPARPSDCRPLGVAVTSVVVAVVRSRMKMLFGRNVGTEAGYRREIGTVGGQVGHSAGERHGFAVRAEDGAEADALHGKLTARGHAEQGRRPGCQVAEEEVFGVGFPYQPPEGA